MPGIAGLITRIPRQRAEAELQRMVAALHHESFYQCGTWIDETMGIYVGWAVLKESSCNALPLRNETEDAVLVFSGEDFPEPGQANRLQMLGHRLEAHGPSYLIHLYEDDASFPAGLNGRFHGLVADRRLGIAKLFNDRFGMHRLYYHEAKDAFYFSAEAKAILAVRPELRRASPQGLGDFVACGSVLENRTLFDGIHVLPSGSAWTFRNGSVEGKNLYFRQQEWEQQEPLQPEKYYQELKEVFTRNLPRYLNGHEPIGMSLTGGLDTRVVMAWQRFPANAFPCYTYGGSLRECRDVRVARKVAGVCRQSHHVLPVGQEFLARFPHYAERSIYLSDACVDLSRSPDLYVSEKAREIAPVRMTGLYGDEVLRHLRAFKPVEPAPGLFRPELLAHVRQAQTTYAALLQEHPLSFSVFRQAPWHHFGIRALEQTQITARTPFLDNEFVRTVFRAPRSAHLNNDLRLRLISDGNHTLGRIRTDRGFGGPRGQFSALAYRAYLEFSFKAEYAYDYGMPQWLAGLDHFFAPLHLERLFLGRHKLFHFRVWYRDTLANYVRDILLDAKALSRPYVERKSVERVVHGHTKGNRNYTTEIHKLLTLELAHRLFLDSQ
jgi:asparagine synthase (glutamine-hydrolysing)